MNLTPLSTLSLLNNPGLLPLPGRVGGAGSTPASPISGRIDLPVGQAGAGTLHVSPHDPGLTPDAIEQAFVAALCTQDHAGTR